MKRTMRIASGRTTDPGEVDLLGDEDDVDEFYKEATVWIGAGPDQQAARHQLLRGSVGDAVLSRARRPGRRTGRSRGWSATSRLTDAIESGLVKIPQLARRDTTGAEMPGYFNIWRWILPQLTPAERGGKKGSPKPEAILKWANTPISMLGGLWEETCAEWAKSGRRPATARVHPRLQEHRDREGRLRVARREQAADGHPAGEDSGLPEQRRTASTRFASTRRS